MLRLGYFIFLALLIARYSRILEAYWWLHIPRWLLLSALGVAIVKGVIRRGWGHRLGRILVGLTALYVLTVPFSVWPGGSFTFLTDHWFRSVLVYFLFAAYCTSLERMRAAVAVIGFSLAYVGIQAARSGAKVTARTTGTSASFGNSNDLAAIMLMGIPLCLFLAVEKRLPLWVRVGGLVGVPAMAYPMSQTGSRMMAVVSCVLLAYMLYKARPAARVAILAGGFAIGVVAVATMPKQALMRLGTIFAAEDVGRIEAANASSGGEQVNQSALNSAVNSTHQRMHLLRRSIALALSNPIFGVGVGQFAVAEHDLSVKEGARRGSWQVAHNAYTEIGSENGVPALIVYLLLLGNTWFAFIRFEAPIGLPPSRRDEWARLGMMIRGSFLMYLCCSLFLSIGYDDFVTTFVALAASGELVRHREMKALQNASEEPAVEPAPVAPVPAYGYGYGSDAVAYTTDAVVEGD